MKIFEIEGYLEKKLRRSTWPKDDFIYFEICRWINYKGHAYPIDEYDLKYTDWEEYQEEETPKRYWLWIMINGSGNPYKQSMYFDDEGNLPNQAASDYSEFRKKNPIKLVNE